MHNADGIIRPFFQRIGNQFLLFPDGSKAVLDHYNRAYGEVRKSPGLQQWYERFETLNTQFIKHVTDWQNSGGDDGSQAKGQALLAAAPAAGTADWPAAFAELDATATPDAGAAHIPALLAELPAGCALFVGNSLAIRQLDSESGSGDKPLTVYGNRGASGIDGNISTALGIAAHHGRVVALLGDLTTQHDLGGLALAAGRDAVIVTVNNGGGGIFDLLPQAALPEFERGWRTPQQISFEHAAATFGLGYARAGDADGLHLALRQAFAAGGPHLIELLLP